MKKLSVLLPMLTLAITGFGGPTNQLHLQYSTGVQPPPPEKGGLTAVPLTNATYRLFRTEKTYGGVLPELKRQKGQFFRARSTNRGAEFQNVSINPLTGRAEGIVLFSIGF